MAAVAELTADLAVPPFPLALEYIWRAYFRLRRRKSPGFNGHNKIEWPDIDAFMRRTGIRLVPWEISLIEDVDDIFCRVMAEASEASPKEQAEAAMDGLGRAGKRHVVMKRGKGG